jgi:hypothetical protein
MAEMVNLKKHKKLKFLTIILLIFLTPLQALALTDAQKQVLDTGIYYFNIDDGTCTVGLDINLSGNDRIEKAYNFFIQNGFSAAQGAGIVGNMIWESGVNPRKVYGGSESSTPVPGKAWGIVQWTGGRVDSLINFAKGHKPPAQPDDLALQLEFVLHEFDRSEKAAGDDIKKQTTPDGAALSFFNKYERADDATGPKRQKLASGVFNKYGDSSGTNQAVPPNSDGNCDVTGTGQDTKYIDGFTVYSQYDPQWVNRPYGSSTIGVSGCGPSAMAMIITALTGTSVTPAQTAKYAGDQGLYIPGEGSSWNLPPVLATHWGLKARAIGANQARITAELQAGGLVIASGQGPEPFTSGGHYLVIRGVTADGKWKIGDSGHNDTSDKEWSSQQLLSSMNDGSVYVITK